MHLAIFFQDIPQGRGIIFPTKRVDVTSKNLLAQLYQYLGKYGKKYCPAGVIRNLRLSNGLKLGSKHRKLLEGMHF